MALHDFTRREFLRSTTCRIAAGALTVPVLAGAASSSGIPTRPLGATGVKVSMLGLGGYHIGRPRDENVGIRLTRRAIDMGVTFLDNAWEYHDGKSEEIVGKALQDGYRDKVFLMTKHHGRDKKTAMRHLEDSLRRLKTDVIDLWQFHEIVYDDDPEMIFAPGGGIEAAETAKKQGKVRFIGFTGHRSPMLHLKMLSYGYPWDAVQMPLNVMDAHYKSFLHNVVPILVRRNIGIIGMKTMGSGHVLRSQTVEPAEALNYVWSQPVTTIVSGMESQELLDANVTLARTFKPMSPEAQAKLLAKTKTAAMSGNFEPFKTAPNYDGPVGRRQHGIS